MQPPLLANNKIPVGFSLIELMIVIAIIAILSSMAIPSYNGHIQKSRRKEGQTELLKIQAMYEEYFAKHNAYPPSHTLPPSSHIPISLYEYGSVTTPTTYQITATATKKQTTDKEGTVSCAVMSIDGIGQKTPDVCWNY